MKKAFCILMALAMITPSLTRMGILIDFKINQDFIAAVLCINKDKPETTCNGKCHLSAQLKKADEQEKKQAPGNQSDKAELLYCFKKVTFTFLKYIDLHTIKPTPTFKKELYYSSFLVDIFKPPQHHLI